MPPAYVDWLVDVLLPVHADDPIEPQEPEQSFVLGNRSADYALCLAFALVLPIVRSILRRLIFQPCGLYCMYSARGLKIPKADNPLFVEKLRKWNESSWKMSVYIVFSVIAFLASYKEIWFYDTRYFWLGCNHFPPCNLYVSKGVLLFYCLQTGFYLQAIHFLTFHEVRRKDWLESMIHHIVTAGLMAYSYYVNFTRAGILIMLLHDISDIFLEGAKLARYSRKATLALVTFAVFFISWVLLRMLYFPLFIIRSTLSEPIVLVSRKYGIEPMPHYLIFNALLLVLLVLHVYWSWLILLVLIKAVKHNGNTTDVREQDEDSDKED